MRLWPFGRREQRSYDYSPLLSFIAERAKSGAGAYVTADSASQLMAVHACVKVISEDVASLPWITYRRLERGRDRATDHDLYSLLHDAPNPEIDAVLFKETLMRHLLYTGNAYGLAEMRAGRAAAIWPIPPWCVDVGRDRRTGELVYTVKLTEAGVTAKLPGVGTGSGFAQQIWHVRGPSNDGVLGMNPIRVARSAIGLGLAQQDFASTFFSRGARPSMVVEHPGALSPEAHERLKADLESTLTGVDNAGRIALLEEGMKANIVGVSQEDAEFLAQRRFSVEEIARLFRVGPHKIQVTEGSMSYASVEQSNIDHVNSTIRPWCVRLEASANTKLLPAEERDTYFSEFLLTALLRGDHASRSEFYRTMWNIGALSQNDIRELENMNPVEGGDRYFAPLSVGDMEDIALTPKVNAATDLIDAGFDPAAALAAVGLPEISHLGADLPDIDSSNGRAGRSGALIGAGSNGRNK